MSKIPYFFDAPIPRYFRENGWFRKKNTVLFVTWAFSRCSTIKREIHHDGKKIILEPFQFIFGRRACAEEIDLTEDEVRAQVNTQLKAGFLKKAPNKTPNRFTIYEWVTECFCNNDPQQNPRLTPNKPPQYKTKEEETKRTTTAPKAASVSAAPVVVSSRSFFSSLALSPKTQARILAKHSPEEIALAVKRCEAWEGRQSDEGALLSILSRSDAWNDAETPEDTEAKNLAFLRTLDALDGQTVARSRITIGRTYAEFAAGAKMTRFSVEDKNFGAMVKEELKRLKEIQ